jgi:hypothetical protein
VAVEKLTQSKFAEISSRQDALSFSILVDIFYPSVRTVFSKEGVFQHPQAITPTTILEPH